MAGLQSQLHQRRLALFTICTPDCSPELPVHTSDTDMVCSLAGNSGPVLLLVHGFGASVYHWRYNIPELAKTHRVFAVDMLGFGWSEKPVLEYGGCDIWSEQIRDFVKEVRQLCTHSSTTLAPSGAAFNSRLDAVLDALPCQNQTFASAPTALNQALLPIGSGRQERDPCRQQPWRLHQPADSCPIPRSCQGCCPPQCR